MSTRPETKDERWDGIFNVLVDRGLTYKHAEIATDYVIECLDVQEKYFVAITSLIPL